MGLGALRTRVLRAVFRLINMQNVLLCASPPPPPIAASLLLFLPPTPKKKNKVDRTRDRRPVFYLWITEANIYNEALCIRKIATEKNPGKIVPQQRQSTLDFYIK